MKFRANHHPRSKQGVALIVVLLMLSLLVMLVLAVFSISDSNLRGARLYASGQQANQLTETAVDLAISQLRRGTLQNATAEGTETWASQPGLIRKYSTTGGLQTAYKLYSSRQMVVSGSSTAVSSTLINDVPTVGWADHPERYVDLNRPAITPNSEGNAQLRFPIIDPRAMTGGADSVAGFSYQPQTANGSSIEGVVTSGGDNQRLPMPVEWLYVLKDGSVGSVNRNGQFVGSVVPTRENPVTGRIAFWTDDESTKVNVNTASEPTIWALPTFYHERDAAYSRYQPVNGEFQRYPGHPATTALSPVLFPGRSLTWQNLEDIYNLVPKIGPGGTKAGTVSYSDDKIAAIALASFRSEHLYSSLDEFWLGPDRKPNQLGGIELSEQDIQRKSFFLTTQSRSPEINPFGKPKIAMWPVSYRGTDYQTSFDNIIAFCSTLRPGGTARPYYFQRGWADSPTLDITQPANLELINYLLAQLSKPVPGFSALGDQHFITKYGADLPQIVLEIFDYIRSTNLHDGNLIKPGDKIIPENTTQNYMLGYAPSSGRAVNFKTFTDPRFFAADPENDDGSGVKELLGYPGHGQVTPSQLTVNGQKYQGIARLPTISEVGLHFICNADNTNDDENPFEQKYADIGKPGGGRALKIKAIGKAKADRTASDYWFSNFPPKPSPNPARDEAPNLTKYPLTDGFPYGKEKTHPGYQRENWNHQLTVNTPLRPGFRRVQARLLMEFFIPAQGYTIIEPDMTVKVSGLSKFMLNGKKLFPNDVETFRTGRRATHPGSQMHGGYGVGLKGLMRGREAPARTPMPADNNWGNDNWEVKPTALPNDNLSVLNYDLLSNYVDIDVGLTGSSLMNISQTDLQIEIYSGHVGRIASKDETAASLVQTLNLTFPNNNVKPPTLVRNPIEDGGNAQRPAVEPPSWWTFHSRGAVGFTDRDIITDRNKLGPVLDKALRGRYFNHNVAPRVGSEPRRGCFFYGFDAAVPAGAPRLFKPQQAKGATQKIIDKAEEDEGSDVVQTVQIKHGDYRLTAGSAVVDKDQWKEHRFYGQRRLAHGFTNFVSDHLPGFDYGGEADLEHRLVPNTTDHQYPNARLPKLPYFEEAWTAAQLYGDFDNGQGPSRDGPYISKPDEGNLRAQNGLSYFTETNNHATVGETFFSPNRLLPSPVMFGSLPTGVKAGVPWRTLLFRPQDGHPGATIPPDHLFLEFFWMPIVEPYAISEPLSTAGKINLNYQIYPFTNIRRATGLHSVLTGETVTAIANEDLGEYKAWPDASNTDKFWSDADNKVWHRPVDIEKTLQQFDQRFASGRSFISPSEICDIHLVPKGTVADYTQMTDFWKAHRPTGDNTRERPYSRIYPRVTTRSNIFRVHYVVQSLKKGVSADPSDLTKGLTVESERRGSAVIERYIDPQSPSLPDFVTDGDAAGSLDAHYKFRVTESKTFGS